ncbi:hypothetical protein HanPSC8_Chr17g0777321 [Helianthus annuus]|nr:hypothetical protein HanPSC8_Chr17g0777321 [Helianthus annuus]
MSFALAYCLEAAQETGGSQVVSSGGTEGKLEAMMTLFASLAVAAPVGSTAARVALLAVAVGSTAADTAIPTEPVAAVEPAGIGSNQEANNKPAVESSVVGRLGPERVGGLGPMLIADYGFRSFAYPVLKTDHHSAASYDSKTILFERVLVSPVPFECPQALVYPSKSAQTCSPASTTIHQQHDPS